MCSLPSSTNVAPLSVTVGATFLLAGFVKGIIGLGLPTVAVGLLVLGAWSEEIAARTVNKERARSGEADQKSRTSTQDMSSSRRGGLRSHSGSGGRTKAQLYNEAKAKGIEGRSKMNKSQLEKAVGR